MFDFLTINWDKLNSAPEIGTLLFGLAAAGVVVYYFFDNKKQKENRKIDGQTIKAYKENTQALEERVKIVEQETSHCQEQHAENLTKITHMEGELKAYKELVLIPADFLKELQRNQLDIIKLIKESNVNTKRIKK